MSSTPVTTSSGGGCGLIDPQVLAQPLENATEKAGDLHRDWRRCRGALRPRSDRDDPLRGLTFLTLWEWEACIVDILTSQQMASHLGVQMSGFPAITVGQERCATAGVRSGLLA